MEKISNKIVFFGSGPVAAKSLSLLAQDFQIEAVITKPTTEKEMSFANSPLFTVSSRQELDNLIDEHSFKSQVAILVDFGIIVSRKVIDAFPLGIVNSHFSLLPALRGADPITFAILNGEPKTGVSLMLIEEKMDTGKLITQKTFQIKPGTTTPELTEDLISLSYELLKEWLPKYMDGKIKPRSQPHPDRATFTRKLNKEDGIIDWTKSAEQIEREIRAYAGWPGSRTELAGKDVIILKARIEKQKPAKELSVQCGDQKYLVIEKIKPAGKNEMTGQAFLAGYGHLL